MNEYLLTTNEYLNPSIAKGADAYGILLVRLLLLEPGTNPLHPGMGVGIGPKYRFISEDDVLKLESRIQDQINTYLPSEFQNVTTVKLQLNEGTKYLSIIIIADNRKYIYNTEESDTPIELSDLV